MAAVMTGYAETALPHPFFVRRRRTDGFWWNTSGTPAFENFSAVNIAAYGIAATEAGATGTYSATDPADPTEGDYVLVAAAGVSLAVSDLATNRRWQDVAGGRSVNLTQAIGSAQTDGTVGAALLGMEAQSVGAWVINLNAKTLTLYRKDGVTVVRTFALDNVVSPTTRT